MLGDEEVRAELAASSPRRRDSPSAPPLRAAPDLRPGAAATGRRGPVAAAFGAGRDGNGYGLSPVPALPPLHFGHVLAAHPGTTLAGAYAAMLSSGETGSAPASPQLPRPPAAAHILGGRRGSAPSFLVDGAAAAAVAQDMGSPPSARRFASPHGRAPPTLVLPTRTRF